MELPTIDLHKRDEREFSQRLDEICRTSGFFQLVGHGLPETVMTKLAHLARVFFSLPLQHKLEIQQPTRNTIRGYIPFGKGALAYTRGDPSPPDLKESFNVGPPSHQQPQPATDVHYADNKWPNEPMALRSACLNYYQQMETLSRQLLQILAIAAGLEADGFEATTRDHVSVLGLAYYPAQQAPPAPGQLRSGAHTDFGSLTILWPEPGSPGLEVARDDGRWTPVSAKGGALIVNIGDFLEHWTEGRWRSVLHRVSNPGPATATSDRLSIGFFQHPNPNLSMASPAADKNDTHALTFGEYLAGKFNSQIRQ